MTSGEINHYPKQFFLLLNYSALLFTLIIVLLSAHIRLGESGLGCDPWPSCYTQSTFQDTTQGLAIPAGEYLELRALHRLFASLLGICVMIIMLIAVWYRRAISPVLPIVMFLVVLFLSILGVTTPSRTAPAVTMGNVLGGIALIALIWRQLLALKPARSCPEAIESEQEVQNTRTARFDDQKETKELAPANSKSRQELTDSAPGPHRLVLLLSVILGLQILTGIWASANYTAIACPNLLTCDFVTNAPANLWNSFDISRELKLDLRGELIFSGHMKTIQFSHRLVSVALLLAVAATFYIVRRDYPALMKPMKYVVTLCLAEILLGVFNIVTEMPLWTNTLHNLLAVALLLSTIYLTKALSNSIGSEPTN